MCIACDENMYVTIYLGKLAKYNIPNCVLKQALSKQILNMIVFLVSPHGTHGTRHG